MSWFPFSSAAENTNSESLMKFGWLSYSGRWVIVISDSGNMRKALPFPCVFTTNRSVDAWAIAKQVLKPWKASMNRRIFFMNWASEATNLRIVG
jgi:hypothetical protein